MSEKSNWCIHTPIGWLKGQSDEKYLHSLTFYDEKPDCSLSLKVNPYAFVLQNYFEGKNTLNDLTIPWVNEQSFSTKVLKACSKIPFGKTSSYSEIAENCGSKGAAQAVGQILKNNSLLLLIPCHRVISKNGSLGGFNAGVDRKKWLLKHESNLYHFSR